MNPGETIHTCNHFCDRQACVEARREKVDTKTVKTFLNMGCSMEDKLRAAFIAGQYAAAQEIGGAV